MWKLKTIKFVGENQNTLKLDKVLARTLGVIIYRTKINELEQILKTLVHKKKADKRMKRKATDSEKIFSKHLSVKERVPNMSK